MGFTSYLFVGEEIKGLADSYKIPGSSGSGDWSQISSRLRPAIRGDLLRKKKKGEYFICLPETVISTRTFVVSKDRGSVGSDVAWGSLTLGLAPTHSSRGTKNPDLHPEGTCATPTEQPGLPGTSKTSQERHHLETSFRKCFFFFVLLLFPARRSASGRKAQAEEGARSLLEATCSLCRAGSPEEVFWAGGPGKG